MACVVSFSFSAPSSASQLPESMRKLSYSSTLYKASLQGRAACHAIPNLSSLANKKSAELTSVNHASGNVHKKATLNYCEDTLLSRSRNLPGFTSCFFIVDQSAQSIISGYWSGPDIEDGWGFVEAYVDRTS